MTRRDRLLLPPATSDTGDVASDRYAPLIEGPARPLPKNWWNLSGYLASVNWRPQPDNPSGAVFWLTVGAHLVDGEETTSLEKLALAVDAANGVGSVLDFTKFVFMNTDTSVHLHRPPRRTKFACFYIELLQY